MKNSFINDILSKVSDHMPKAAKDCGEEFERGFRSALEAVLSKLDLVTREEFDVQCELLSRTREKVDNLEEKLTELLSEKKSKKTEKKADKPKKPKK